MRRVTRALTWPLRGHSAESKMARFIVWAVGVMVVVELATRAYHALGGLLSGGVGSPGVHAPGLVWLVVLAVIALALVAAALLARVRHERERRAEDPSHALRSHHPAALVLLALGAVAGALPSALPWAPVARIVLTVVVAGAFWSWAWQVAGAQRGAEPQWRAGLRLGTTRLVKASGDTDAALRGRIVALVLAAAATAWLAVACVLGILGGDAGLVALGLVMVAATAEVGKRASAETAKWWRLATAAAGHARLSHVRVIPSWGTAPWQADITLRAGELSASVDRTAAQLDGLLFSANPADPEWEVTAKGEHRLVKARVMDSIPATAMAPTTVAPGTHWQLPLGVVRGGGEICLDVSKDPHALVAGKTGSGKSVALATLAMGALLRGWQLVIAETVKAGLDFESLRPWCAGWGTDLEAAADVLDDVYAEVKRRRGLLAAAGANKISGLPAGSRPAPILVVIDEFFSMVVPIKSKTAEAVEINAVKARIADCVGRLMREARFADVHLILGLQRPDAIVFAGEVKANTGLRLLCGSSDPIARQMALRDAENAPVVRKGSKGRALVETDEHDAQQVQVYHCEVAPAAGLPKGTPIVAAVLHQAGVPYATPCLAPIAGWNRWPRPRSARWWRGGIGLSGGVRDGRASWCWWRFPGGRCGAGQGRRGSANRFHAAAPARRLSRVGIGVCNGTHRRTLIPAGSPISARAIGVAVAVADTGNPDIKNPVKGGYGAWLITPDRSDLPFSQPEPFALACARVIIAGGRLVYAPEAPVTPTVGRNGVERPCEVGYGSPGFSTREES